VVQVQAMSGAALHIITFICYTSIIGFITYLLCRRMATSGSIVDDHFIGSRSFPWYVVSGSLMLTNLSTEQLVGLNGGIFKDGCLAGITWEVFAALAMICTAQVFLPRYLASGFSTTTGFLGERFDRFTRTLVSAVFLVFYTLGLCPSVLYTGALAIKNIFELHALPLWAISTGIGLLGAVYALVGGLKAVAVSDCLNGIGLLIVGLWVPIAGLLKVGGISAAFEHSHLLRPFVEKGSIFDCIEAGVDRDLGCFRKTGTVSVPWHTNMTGMLLANLYYWSTNQLIVQRALAARSLADGQKGIMFAAFMKIIGFLILCIPGVVAILMVEKGIVDISKADEAYPELVRAVMPDWSLGLFAAVLLGSVLSTFNSALNSAATLFVLEIYGVYVRPQCSEHHSIRVGTLFGICCSITSFAIAPWLSSVESIYDFLQRVKTLASLPILTLFVVGIATAVPDAFAAKFAFITGLIVYSGFAFYDTPYWLHIYFASFVACVCVMLLATYSQPVRRLFKQPVHAHVPDPNHVSTTEPSSSACGSKVSSAQSVLAPWEPLNFMSATLLVLISVLLLSLQIGSLWLHTVFWLLWGAGLLTLLLWRRPFASSYANKEPWSAATPGTSLQVDGACASQDSMHDKGQEAMQLEITTAPKSLDVESNQVSRCAPSLMGNAIVMSK